MCTLRTFVGQHRLDNDTLCGVDLLSALGHRRDGLADNTLHTFVDNDWVGRWFIGQLLGDLGAKERASQCRPVHALDRPN